MHVATKLMNRRATCFHPNPSQLATCSPFTAADGLYAAESMPNGIHEAESVIFADTCIHLPFRIADACIRGVGS